MSGPALIDHHHTPLYRVVRRGWADPLDSSFSRRQSDNRWNTADFPALYACCSEGVARAVTLDIFRMAGVELSDLRTQAQPGLIEFNWHGPVADMISAAGITAAGFAAEYPLAADKRATRRAAEQWHANGVQGVVCRSASLSRQGFREWKGNHQRWSELAVFTDQPPIEPLLLRRREDLEWFALSRLAER